MRIGTRIIRLQDRGQTRSGLREYDDRAIPFPPLVADDLACRGTMGTSDMPAQRQ